VFRVAEKLGMKLEGIFGNDVLSPLRRRFSYPRLKRHPDIFDEFLKHGRSTFFHDTPGWFWSRTLPARRDWINQGGYVACGVPLHIDHRVHAKGEHSTTVSLLELPYDPKPLFSGLLAYARRRSWIVVNYPVEWKRKVRRTWRELIPSLRHGRRYYSGAERVYGKYL
jgi:hypothetical protein